MIIANPIYDVVFKYLMEDLELAKGILSRILNEQITAIDFSAREHSWRKEAEGVLSLFRMDFVATIRKSDGTLHKVLIELQKARLGADLVRFRRYLGSQYRKLEEVVGEDGVPTRQALPIIAIYFLGFVIEERLPSATHGKRLYFNAFTGEQIALARADFVEHLTHDGYFIQIPKLADRAQNALGRILSVFEQTRFVDDVGHKLEYPEVVEDDELLRRILRKLEILTKEAEVQEQMELEDEAYEETQLAIDEGNRELRRSLQQEQRKREEVTTAAVQVLLDLGISEEEARKRLGL